MLGVVVFWNSNCQTFSHPFTEGIMKMFISGLDLVALYINTSWFSFCSSCCYRPCFTDVVVVVKVGALEDFSIKPQPLHTETISVKTSEASQKDPQRSTDIYFFPIFFYRRNLKTRVSSNKQAFEASKKTVSTQSLHLLSRRLP